MSINRFRAWLYRIAKYSGDLQAVTSKKEGAIWRRLVRRAVGWFLGKHIMGRLFK